MIRLTPAVAETLGRSAKEATSAFSSLTRALLVLNGSGKPLYAGTVAYAEVARRRAASKVARRSRRINRA